jgi:ABC-type transport system involved in multi-copper enzyme maturation permease subunit
MSLQVLLKDELRGFYRSKVMLFLWAGLPALVLIMHLYMPDTDEIPLTTFSSLIIASLAGTLGAVMLAVSIVNEKGRRVYDLFLIRPIRRRDIVLSKFLAVYLCLVAAGVLALLVGIGYDVGVNGTPSAEILDSAVESLSISLAMMAVSSAVGVLIGIASPSVVVAAILVIYGGGQISTMTMVPSIMGWENEAVMTVLIGIVLASVLMAISILAFDRKQF